MITLGRKTKQEGNVLESYFDAAQNEELGHIEIKGKKGQREDYETFEHEGDKHAIVGYEHCNGHFSNYTDKAAVFAVLTKKVNP